MADTTSTGAKLFSDLKRDFGLTDVQAAGVVGNFMHESAGFTTLQEINPSSGRGGYGFAQWTGDRRKSFESYVKSNDLDPASYEANYGFLRHELATDRYERQQFNKVKKATTAAEAARIVSTQYLRPGTPRLGERTRLANKALAFADMPVPPSDLNYDVGTRTDTVPPAPPMPATPSPDMRMMRGVMGNAAPKISLPPMGTPDVGSIYAGIYAEPRLTQPGAVNASVDRANAAQSPELAAALARKIAPKIAPPMPTRVAQSYAGQERAAAAKAPMPARLPALPPTAVGKAPTTRAVQSVPVPVKTAQVSASDKARGSAAQTRNVATTVAVIPTTPTAAQTEAKRMAAIYAGGGPTRAPTAPPMPTGAQIAAATPFGQKIPDRLPSTPMAGSRATAPIAVPSPVYSVASVTGKVNAAGKPVTSPVVLTAAAKPPKAAPVPVSARPMSVGTSLDVQPPMPVVRVPAPVQAPVVKQQPTVLEQMGANFMDRTPIGKLMTAAGPLASNLAAGRPAFAQAPMPAVVARPGGRAAPVPVMPYAPMTRAQHPLLGLLDAMAGQRQPGDLLTRLIGPSAPRPPVGASLGKAANGGQMIQGNNGVKNSITQNSDAWKKATGQSSYGSGQSNDTRYESYF